MRYYNTKMVTLTVKLQLKSYASLISKEKVHEP